MPAVLRRDGCIKVTSLASRLPESFRPGQTIPDSSLVHPKGLEPLILSACAPKAHVYAIPPEVRASHDYAQ